jgi:hypothetical protein
MGCCCCERLRLGGYDEGVPTLSPVVTISSPMDDSEDDDGCEDTSTQDSEFAGISSWFKCDAAPYDRPSFRRWGDGVSCRPEACGAPPALRCPSCRARWRSEGAIANNSHFTGGLWEKMALAKKTRRRWNQTVRGSEIGGCVLVPREPRLTRVESGAVRRRGWRCKWLSGTRIRQMSGWACRFVR